MRKFDSGGVRDEDQSKINPQGCLDPLVMHQYFEYMHRHAFLKDGSYRKEGNWKNLFGDDHLQVCIESLTRHFHDLDLFHNGYQGRDSIEDALCGILFNTIAYYYKLLKDKSLTLKDGYGENNRAKTNTKTKMRSL